MPSAEKKLKALLSGRVKAPTVLTGARCPLCQLPPDKKKLLEIVLKTYRDAGKPSYQQLAYCVLRDPDIGIECSPGGLRVHYLFHWRGRHGKG